MLHHTLKITSTNQITEGSFIRALKLMSQVLAMQRFSAHRTGMSTITRFNFPEVTLKNIAEHSIRALSNHQTLLPYRLCSIVREHLMDFRLWA